ncbi:MAG: hypothetical protein CVT94_03630 [Bacteroidetes bacterium HGW-Bacteroidetes-11]|jgi:hypothetical protein|nr:MAG: hypothetical protein CVT94_03630 [Bacteroidetes bacterium HGW-Bacteroidetes-11]
MKINQNLNEINFNRSSLISKILIVKIFLLLSVFIIFQQDGFAQESSNYVMYRNSIFVFNPGATGLHQKTLATLNAKYYPKLGFSPEIKSVSVSFEKNSPAMEGGIGFAYSYEQIENYSSQHAAGISYSYHFDLHDAGVIGAGIYVGMIFSNISHLNGANFSRLFYVPGVAYKYKNFDLGVSVGIRFRDGSIVREPNIFNSPVVNAFSSYKFMIGPKFGITPGIYAVFYPNSESNYEGNRSYSPLYNLNLTASFSDKFWLGFAYVHNKSNDKNDPMSRWMFPTGLHVSAGVDIAEKFRFGVSVAPNHFTDKVSGNHPDFGYFEFVFAYKVGLEKVKER